MGLPVVYNYAGQPCRLKIRENACRHAEQPLETRTQDKICFSCLDFFKLLLHTRKMTYIVSLCSNYKAAYNIFAFAGNIVLI